MVSVAEVRLCLPSGKVLSPSTLCASPVTPDHDMYPHLSLILSSLQSLLLLARLPYSASMHTGTFPNRIQLLICYRLQWLLREPLSFLFIWSGSDVIKVTVNGECLVNWKPQRSERRRGQQGRVAFLGGCWGEGTF